MAYVGDRQAAAAYGPGGYEELAEVLCLYATTMQTESALEAVPVIKSAVDKLAAATFRQRVQSQLEQLSGWQERLLTVQQLQYGCCCCAFKYAILVAKALHLATCCPLEVGRSSLAAALELYEQTAETALRRCKRLLPVAWVLALGHGVQMARALLPRVHGQLKLLRQASSSSRGNSGTEARTALLASASAQRAAAANEHERISVQGDLGLCPAAVVCNGCGELAVGLRRCARCKQAQYCRCAGAVAWLVLSSCTALAHYCYMASATILILRCTCSPFPRSRECQMEHWGQHKHECRPA